MFYSQIILAKKGPLAKVWLAAHHGEKKLARPQIFATDIPQTVMDICNPSVPLALRVSGHLLLGVVRIYSRKVKYVLHDCTEAMLKLQMAFSTTNTTTGGGNNNTEDLDLNNNIVNNKNNTMVVNFGEYDQVHVVEGFCLPLDTETDWILAEDEGDHENTVSQDTANTSNEQNILDDTFLTQPPYEHQQASQSQQQPSPEQWVPFDPEEAEEPMESFVSDVEVPRAANDDSFLSNDQVRNIT
jgi:cohesin complex subunit SCC1